MKAIHMGKAQWVSTGGQCAAPLIRGCFRLPAIRKATLTIAGLGMYEWFVNGQRATDDLFLPLNTDYHERGNLYHGGLPFREELGHRLYCPVYDITDFLTEGPNTLCFLMGTGWYAQPYEAYGFIKLCWRIDYTDADGHPGEVLSGEGLVWKEGFVKESNLITGERHDDRGYADDWMNAAFDASGWNKVSVEEPLTSPMYEQECPADRIIRHVAPKLIRQDGDRRLYDAGEMITGYPILTARGPADIRVRYGELLSAQGELDEEHIYGQHTDFITEGNHPLHSRFTWLCFRYFEVTGPAEVTDCVVIHSDVPVTSRFHCENETLNWIHQAYLRTQLNNMHCGIPSDCPHVERRGYTGDGQLTCRAAMLQLDAKAFYRKWMEDIADCQDRKTGHVQYTAPFLSSGGGPGGWGCAIVMVPYAYYLHYGDTEVLRSLYPQMLFWFDWMEAHSEDELVTSDLPNVWCLGDWCAPAMGFNELSKMVLPEPLVNTYFYIKSMEAVLEIGKVLGVSEHDEALTQRIRRKKQAVVRHYFEPDTGHFAGNQQGSNAYAIDLGLGDERTWNGMLAYYRERGTFDTGIFATDILTRLLFERGEQALALRLMADSFQNQMDSGATTISEYWTVGIRSQCHPMFGAVSRYLYEYILGVRPAGAAYADVVIEPACMQLIKRAEGHVTVAAGRIDVAYDEERIRLSIPEGLRATLRLNGTERVLPAGETILPL